MSCRRSGTDKVPYYVYVILCEGNNFYTGYTKNLNTRLRLHLRGKGARYTRMHRPQKLVHAEEYSTRSEAMKREKRIKKLNHAQKMRLASRSKSLKGSKRKKLPL
jgi:putative endonuclease